MPNRVRPTLAVVLVALVLLDHGIQVQGNAALAARAVAAAAAAAKAFKAARAAPKAVGKPAATRVARPTAQPTSRGVGPSQKPKVHHVQHATRKQAHDAARQQGHGRPIHHPESARAGHYHATDRWAEKMRNGVHHRYGPKR